MYKGAQRKQDWIGRTGSASTRYSPRMYESEISELERKSISTTDPMRMDLQALQDERASLVANLHRAEEIIRECKRAGDTAISKRMHHAKFSLGTRIGLLNAEIKTKNIAYSRASVASNWRRAIEAVFGSEGWERVVAIKTELENTPIIVPASDKP